MENNEHFIKISFNEDSINFEGRNVCKADVVCALFTIMTELEKDDCKHYISLIRRVGKAVREAETLGDIIEKLKSASDLIKKANEESKPKEENNAE